MMKIVAFKIEYADKEFSLYPIEDGHRQGLVTQLLHCLSNDVLFKLIPLWAVEVATDAVNASEDSLFNTKYTKATITEYLDGLLRSRTFSVKVLEEMLNKYSELRQRLAQEESDALDLGG